MLPRLIRFTLPLLLLCSMAWAAEVDGVIFPATIQANGKTLTLNGAGLRTWSILSIHIYAAGLYLEHPRTSPEDILKTRETRLMNIVFRRDIDADQARDAWRIGLENNCQPPCALDPADLKRFLAEIPAMRAGEVFTLLFTGSGAIVTAGGRPVGTVTRPEFADAMLATFLGPKPASPALKQALLQGHP